ncbi:hypothetical protein Tco_1206375, partial [Tanacetum coccineum]
MSTSKTYQQSLAEAGSETRPPMLERGSYIHWVSRFKRFLNRKRENRKWLLKALEDGPYVFRNITPTGSTLPRLQEVEDLQGDDLLYYDAEMELMNMILLSIPNEIYNSVDSCKTAKEMWDRVKLCLAKKLTVDSFDDLFDYLSQFEKLVNTSRAKKLEKSHDPLALVAHTGSSSRNTSSYYVTHPPSVVDYDEEFEQDDVHNHSEDPLASAMLLLAKAITQNFSNRTNICLRASSNTRNQAVVQGDRDEADGILTDEQNDFLFADALRMKEIKELSANICLMARIQPADQNSDDEPSYESAFVRNVISGSVEKDTHVYDQCALETFARNAYDEAAKQQRFAQKDNNYLKEFLEADERAKRVQKQAESQLYRDRDIIRDLEKQRD